MRILRLIAAAFFVVRLYDQHTHAPIRLRNELRGEWLGTCRLRTLERVPTYRTSIMTILLELGMRVNRYAPALTLWR
jgi:hypothetical protein